MLNSIRHMPSVVRLIRPTQDRRIHRQNAVDIGGMRRIRRRGTGQYRHTKSCGRLTNRWSGRVENKVPSSYIGVRAAQLNR